MAQINILYVFLASIFLGYATAHQDVLTRLSDIAVNLVNVVGDNGGEIKTDVADVATLMSALTKGAIDLENQTMPHAKLDALKAWMQNMMFAVREDAKTQKDKTDSKIEELLTRLNESETKIQQLEQRVAEHKAQPFAGFTAWSDISDTYSTGETVQFNQVLFNYGSAYNSSTSKFTCPLPGIYSVNVHVEEEASSGFVIEAMLDSSKLFNIYVRNVNDETSSTSAMVGCLTGQTIYIKAAYSNVVSLDHGQQKCIFSVHLIQPMSENDVTSGRMF